ncbi:MAG TPA: hypothetical protein VMW41_05965 [Candidatus Bathyarchaeia archaeon]|nr:hypothetical protein [Candidatus Bathyarchaeia archaeon]
MKNLGPIKPDRICANARSFGCAQDDKPENDIQQSQTVFVGEEYGE